MNILTFLRFIDFVVQLESQWESSKHTAQIEESQNNRRKAKPNREEWKGRKRISAFW